MDDPLCPPRLSIHWTQGHAANCKKLDARWRREAHPIERHEVEREEYSKDVFEELGCKTPVKAQLSASDLAAPP